KPHYRRLGRLCRSLPHQCGENARRENRCAGKSPGDNLTSPDAFRSGVRRNLLIIPSCEFEFYKDVCRVLPALIGTLDEAFFDNVVQEERSGWLNRQRGCWILRQDCGDQAGLASSLESPFASDHLVHDRSESKDIRTSIGFLTFELFRRHVLQRSDN